MIENKILCRLKEAQAEHKELGMIYDKELEEIRKVKEEEAREAREKEEKERLAKEKEEKEKNKEDGNIDG